MVSDFSHIDGSGNAVMVGISDKAETLRIAEAEGYVYMGSVVLDAIEGGMVHKGNVLSIAQLAGIMGSKRTSDLVPLCHPLSLEHVSVDISLERERGGVLVRSRVSLTGRTGVEMEALTAVMVSCLTIYDMCKSMEKGMRIGDIVLVSKSGGRSGDYSIVSGG